MARQIGPHIVEVDSHSTAIKLLNNTSQRFAYLYSTDVLQYVLSENKIKTYYVSERPNTDTIPATLPFPM